MTVPLVSPPLNAEAPSSATTKDALKQLPPPAAKLKLQSTSAIALGTQWENNRPLWIFGYGSIIYRVDFPVEASIFGFIRGRKRAFLQESHDHRGTEENPGRVCTLIPCHEWNQMFENDKVDDPEQEVCWGVAYKVESGKEREVKDHLDYREKDGYTIDFVDVYTEEGKPPVLSDVMVYVGVSTNPSFAGASSIEDTARVIARAEGPSGTNREYLFKLCNALRERKPGSLDPYLAALEKRVAELIE
ncbi:ChaC-domain-containing protein [Martensiomyces pterosporus]|nr:ChaC-domain-containing protein [Martensiomyces pterosporus]